MSRKATKRTAYVSGLWAMIPDEVDPGFLRQVPTRILFFDCPVCKQLAGQRCKGRNGFTSSCHADRGHGKAVRFEDRVAMAGGLIAAKRFDEIQILDVRVVLRKEGGEE